MYEFGQYKNGLKNGLWQINAGKESTRITENYKDGQKNGEFKCYTGGKIRRRGFYKDDKLDGLEQMYWYSDVMDHYNYHSGWWFNYMKELRIFTFYKNGKKIKKICYDENGKEVLCPTKIFPPWKKSSLYFP